MKILHFIYGLHIGGAESFLKNLLVALQYYNNYEFYFVIQDREISNEFFTQFKQTHPNKFFYIPKITKNPISHFLELRKVLRNNAFDAVHIHMNSFVNPIPIIICRSQNIPIIVHSHNTKNAMGGKFGYLFHHLNRNLFNYDYNVKLACGTEAGHWMFRDKKFDIIHNAIDIESYKYKEDNNQRIRKQLQISPETMVIGIVGRLHPQKNHKRAIQIFKKFQNLYPDSRMLVIGDGSLKKELIELTHQLDISERTSFLGSIQDVSSYYSAMNILIFPSFYEGLGIVGIEAQASGLKIIASDTVPQEMDISGQVRFLSLELSDEEWIQAIIDGINKTSSDKRPLENDKLMKSLYSLPGLAYSMNREYTKIYARKR